MIIDQQRRAETTANRYIIDQIQSSGVKTSNNRIHPGAMQPFFEEHTHISTGNTALGVRTQTAYGAARNHHSVDALLPVSAISLEEDMASYRDLARRVQPILSRPRGNPNTIASCTCRKRLQEKRFIRQPCIMLFNQSHFHEASCSYRIPGCHNIELGLVMILWYLMFGLRIRLFMKLLVGNGTFSIMPSLSIGRVVTVESSPAFEIIDLITNRWLNPTEIRSKSMELTRIFQTRQASPHERLQDGRTLLHVSVHSPRLASLAKT